jgi:hypothetical protein
MTHIQARLTPQRRKLVAAPARRAYRYPRKPDDGMTKMDCLIEVAKKLKEARALGEACSDPALLYFIDMTIVHVCDTLSSRSQSQDAAEPRLNLVHASH